MVECQKKYPILASPCSASPLLVFPASPFLASPPLTSTFTISNFTPQNCQCSRTCSFAALLRTGNALASCRSYHGKINIQRPRTPHYEKQLFQAVTRPQFPRLTAVDLCQQRRQKKQLTRREPREPHPFKLLLTNELFKWFDEANMILLCHMGSMSQLEYFNFRVECHRKNVTTKIYSRQIIRMALQGTRFEAMLPVLMRTGHNCMLFSNEWAVADVLKITKRMPKMVVLCGALDGRMCERNQLEHVGRLPDKTTLQAQFVATLNSVGGQLVGNLQAHQSNLCQLLDARADALKPATPPTDADQE